MGRRIGLSSAAAAAWMAIASHANAVVHEVGLDGPLIDLSGFIDVHVTGTFSPTEFDAVVGSFSTLARSTAPLRSRSPMPTAPGAASSSAALSP